MPSLDLRGPDIEALSQALRKAFPIQRLRELFAFRLDKRLEDYSLGGDYKEVIFDVIMAAEAEGWTAELVVVARQSNPGNAALQACAERVHLGASTPTLERIVPPPAPKTNPASQPSAPVAPTSATFSPRAIFTLTSLSAKTPGL